MNLRNLVLTLVVSGTAAFCQAPAVLDAPLQVKYAANMNVPNVNTYIDIINTGYNGNPLLGPGVNRGGGFTYNGIGKNFGNICVNVYTLAQDEQLVSCCSCKVTPNQVVSLAVFNDLLSKSTLTIDSQNSVTVKLLGSLGTADPSGVSDCSTSAATAGTTSNPIVKAGFIAFGTVMHGTSVNGVYDTTETPFLPVALPATSSNGNTEIQSLAGRCASILGNGSGYGVCNSCSSVALGASKK